VSLTGFTTRERAVLLCAAVTLGATTWSFWVTNPLGMADWWSRGGVAFVLGYVVVFVIIRLVSVGLDRLEKTEDATNAD